MSIKLDKTDFAYNSQLDAFELYHLIIEDEKRPSHRNGGPVLPALGHALAGSVATATSKLLIYPLDLVIARLQVQKQLRSPKNAQSTEYKGLVDAATKIYRHEGGLSAFYTGCTTDVAKGIADSFLFFLAYSFLQQRQLRKLSPDKKRMTVAQEMGIGIVAGAFSKLITTPLQNIITRQQTAALAVAHNTESDDNLKKGDSLTITDIARQIHKERGLAGFWTGYSLSLILTLNPAITFAVDNFLQKSLRAQDLGSAATFLVAAVSKAVATTITYPVSVAKSRAQAKPQDEEKQSGNAPRRSRLFQLFAAQYAVLLSLRNIYRQDGLSGLYSGIEAEVLKGFLSHGLTMMMKDRVHDAIIELYYLLLKATRKWPAEFAAQKEAASDMIADAKERVENAGTSALDAGKNIAAGASERIEDAGHATYEAGKNMATGAAHRVENAGTSVYEAGKNIASSTSERAQNIGTTTTEAGKNIASGASERAENVGVTAIEAGKSATSNVKHRTESLGGSTLNTGRDLTSDAKSRAENIGVTTVEAGKSVAAHSSKQAQNVTGTAVEVGKNVLSDVKERADNIGVTVVEAGKSVLPLTKK